MLIGGPNQSHKVNFKELPDMGKSSNKKYRFVLVNNFFEDFKKTFKANWRTQGTFPSASGVFYCAVRDGSADNGNRGPMLKKFLPKRECDYVI